MSAAWHPEVVLEPRFRWSFPDPARVAPDLARGRRRTGIGERMTGLLARRGVTDAAGLGPGSPSRSTVCTTRACCPTPTGSSPGSPALATRSERVMVFGDFDADGLDGLAILVLALRRYRRRRSSRTCRAGSRRGTGCRWRRSTRPCASGVTVIVTVDMRVELSGAEIAVAATRGIDVIVTDHHRVPPAAAAGARGRQPASRRLARIPTRGWPAAASPSRSPS